MFRSLVKRFQEVQMNKQEVLMTITLIILLYVSSSMMFFGMNFWLWSFTKGLKRSYTSMLIPSFGWALLFCIFSLILWLVQWYYGRHEDFLFWVCRKGIILLFLIGFFDSLTGLCFMYSVVHIPVILQSALISTGPIWTYLLASIIYPESQPSFSPVLLIVLACTAGGVIFAMLPQIQSNHRDDYFSLPWIAIYLAGTALFPLYNVLQGRFLHEFRNSSSPFTSKIIMLTVETLVQLFFVLCYFPIDSSPFFGKTDSLQESWEMLIASVNCIGTCHRNAMYMVIYILGFWIHHLVFAYINSYSPTIVAVTSQLTQPINTFILLVIPSWNVYGAKAFWYYTLGCFFLLLISTIIFVGWHFSHRRNLRTQWERESMPTIECLVSDEEKN